MRFKMRVGIHFQAIISSFMHQHPRRRSASNLIANHSSTRSKRDRVQPLHRALASEELELEQVLAGASGERVLVVYPFADTVLVTRIDRPDWLPIDLNTNHGGRGGLPAVEAELVSFAVAV